MIKAAFFDIDGTLLSFKTHRIPASAQQVLDSFREQGIACVIATGRPTYQMPDWLFDLGWDASTTRSRLSTPLTHRSTSFAPLWTRPTNIS